MNIKEWLSVIAVSIALMSSALAGGKWLADQHYVTQEGLIINRINDLDDRITFLQIKIDQQEASNSEKIYIEALKQKLRSLQSELE